MCAAMKTSIDHLPDDQQQKLQAITAVFTSPDVAIPIDMLILFGSKARRLGGRPETGYKVTTICWLSSRTSNRVNDLTVGISNGRCARSSETHPLTFIVQQRTKIPDRAVLLRRYRERRVMLFDRRRFSLAKPKALNAQERLALAERNLKPVRQCGKFWRES